MFKSYFNALNAEFIKAKSIKSTWIIALLALAFNVGISFIYAISYNGQYKQGILEAEQAGREFSGSDSIWALTTIGVTFSLIALVIFAILSVTAEFNYNTINTSLIATPRRGVFFLAKSTFIALYVLINMLIGLLLAFFVSFSVTSDVHKGDFEAAFTNQIGNYYGLATLGVTLLALMAAFLGFLLRNSAAVVAVVVVVVSGIISQTMELVNHLAKLDIVLRIQQFIPDILNNALVLPDNSGPKESMQKILSDESILQPLTNLEAGIAMVCLTVILGGIAFILFRKRDA